MEGPVTRDEHYRRLKEHYETDAYKATETVEQRDDFYEDMLGTRWEVTEAIYDEALEMMPPKGWRGDTFYVSEALYGDVHSQFSREGDRYFHTYAAFPPRKSLTELYNLALAAEEKFQTALEQAFGKAASEVRYQAKLQPPAIRQLGKAFAAASERYGNALRREQRKQSRPQP